MTLIREITELDSSDEGGGYLQLLLLQSISDRTRNLYFLRKKEFTDVLFDAGAEFNISINQLEKVLQEDKVNKRLDRPYSQAALPRELFGKIENYWRQIYGLKNISDLNSPLSKKINFGIDSRQLDMTISLERSEKGNYHLKLNYDI